MILTHFQSFGDGKQLEGKEIIEEDLENFESAQKASSKNLEDISNKIEEELNGIDHDDIVSEISENGIVKSDQKVIG